jgi:hypothetical protein
MQPKKVEARKAVGAAPDLGSKEDRPTSSNSPRTSKQARRAGTHRYEEGGRYVYRYGNNGVTVFDLAKLVGWTPARGGRI